MYICACVYIHRMSGGSIFSNFSQVQSKSAKVGQTGWGTIVGLESGNCAVELASHNANTHLPDVLPPLLYISKIYIYTERLRGSGARGRIQSWQGGGCADSSGHGGGAGRERLPRPGHLCVCAYGCVGVVAGVCRQRRRHLIWSYLIPSSRSA